MADRARSWYRVYGCESIIGIMVRVCSWSTDPVSVRLGNVSKMKWLNNCIWRRLNEKSELCSEDDIGDRKRGSKEVVTDGDVVLLCSTVLDTPCDMGIPVYDVVSEIAYGDWLDTVRPAESGGL